jgi:hypothetical protein
MINNILVAGATASALASVFFVIAPTVRKTRSMMEWLEKFRRDWEGEPGGPGRDAVPGVMERLNRLDGELSNNGGSSMKDAIERIEKSLGTQMSLHRIKNTSRIC